MIGASYKKKSYDENKQQAGQKKQQALQKKQQGDKKNNRAYMLLAFSSILSTSFSPFGKVANYDCDMRLCFLILLTIHGLIACPSVVDSATFRVFSSRIEIGLDSQTS